VLGKWFESVSNLIAAHPGQAGKDRHKVAHYDRSNVAPLSRAFNAAKKGERLEPDAERARARRHIYKLDKSGGFGLDDTHMQMIREAGIGSVFREFGPDVMLEKMQKLFETGKAHGIGISIHELDDEHIAIDVTPPPLPQPKLTYPPPRKGFSKGF